MRNVRIKNMQTLENGAALIICPFPDQSLREPGSEAL